MRFKHTEFHKAVATARELAGTKYTAQTATWLNGDEWKNQPALSAVPAGDPAETLWRVRTTNWVPGKYWNRDQWGPAPNEPGCKVPSQILAEFEPMRRTG